MDDTYRSFRDIVADNAGRWPDRTYVFCLDQEKGITYGELHRLSNRMAGFLGKRGFAANDRVLLLAENSVEYLAVFVATLRFGGTIATVHVEMNAAHMADIIGAVNPKLVLYQDGLGLEELRHASPGEWLEL
ncbi:MAG: acyl--CoA ligase, partial [Pedosphaera sp.]|nr:acyl--CoA ligase [Pedosphaera sp.]